MAPEHGDRKNAHAEKLNLEPSGWSVEEWPGRGWEGRKADEVGLQVALGLVTAVRSLCLMRSSLWSSSHVYSRKLHGHVSCIGADWPQEAT